jgi:arabinogalactan endo-1,4-beta-galactosidase
MAKRCHAAGLDFVVDFHYSDWWADPGHQFKPSAWERLDFAALSDVSFDAYSSRVIAHPFTVFFLVA